MFRLPSLARAATPLTPLQRLLRVSAPVRTLATDAETAAQEQKNERARRKAMKPPPPDPFTSTQPLTRLVRLPTLSGNFDVTKPTHTKVRVRDRKYLAWAAHRFEDDLVTRKWSKKTIARQNRTPQPWTLNAAQLQYLRLYGPKVPAKYRAKHFRPMMADIEKAYIQKLLDQTHAKSGEDGDLKNAPKTPTPFVGAPGSHIPKFKAGDKIRITKYISMQKEKFEEITGIVLARYGGMKYLKGRPGQQAGLGRLNASFRIRNRVLGECFEMTFPLYSPFIKKIEVIEAGTYRKTKLYYLRDKDPATYMT